MRLAALVVALVSSLSLAQTQTPRPAPAPKAQKVDFSQPDLIGGEPARPFGDIFVGKVKPEFQRLFKVRANFDDKLMQSVNEM